MEVQRRVVEVLVDSLLVLSAFSGSLLWGGGVAEPAITHCAAHSTTGAPGWSTRDGRSLLSLQCVLSTFSGAYFL